MNPRIGLAFFAAVFAAAGASAAAQRIDPMPVEQAFRAEARAANGAIEIEYQMAEGLYLYRDRFHFEAVGDGARIGETQYPPAVSHEDPFFGETQVYYNSVVVRAPVVAAAESPSIIKIAAVSQGCDEQVGICYPPQEQIFAVAWPPAAAAAASTTNNADADEAGAATAILRDGNLLWIVAAFFGFGLLLSFTPCVLPMAPVVAGIVAAQAGAEGKAISKPRAAALGAAYVLGAATLHTTAGVAAGFAGRLFSAWLQTPPVLIAFALVIGALSLSLFGVFEFRLPAPKFASAPPRRGRGMAGAFALGGASALILSPCVAAPLAGALAYVGQTGDAVLGGVALFSMSLGMGVLLMATAIFSGAALPRVGAWANDVKRVAGLMMLAVAVWMLSPLLPTPAVMLLYGALLVAAAIFLRALDSPPAGAGAAWRFVKAGGVVCLLWGALLLLGAASGGRDVLRPLSHWRQGGAAESATAPLRFEAVRSEAELESALQDSARPAMLEFYADWCVSCKEMEAFTFSDSRVRERLGRLTLLRADVTENDLAARDLLTRFRLFGPPGIVFFDVDGREIRGARVIGFESADDFLRSLDAAGV